MAMADYFDAHGLIVQKDGDGGDTAQRTGMYYFGLWIRHFKMMGETKSWPRGLPSDFLSALDALEASPGVFRRHPTQWNDPNDFSRDQQTPIVIALGAFAYRARLSEIYVRHRARGFKYQNSDYASPEHVNMYFRGFGVPPPWGTIGLWAGDLFMLFNSLFRVLLGHFNHDDVGDDLNHIMSLLQAHFFQPTWLSRFARWIYVNFRFGGPQYALDHYFRPETGGPPINELYRPIIQRFMS